MLLVSVALSQSAAPTQHATLEKIVASKLPALGHRNWIVVADSAYPLQTSPGIETINVNVDHLTAISQTLRALKKTKHVMPNVFVDRELQFVPEDRTPGITRFRNSLTELLKGQKVERLLHEQIIKRLDEAGKSFRILLIKTPHVQPYTSVFFQLECGYWSAEAEKELRDAMKKSGG